MSCVSCVMRSGSVSFYILDVLKVRMPKWC